MAKQQKPPIEQQVVQPTTKTAEYINLDDFTKAQKDKWIDVMVDMLITCPIVDINKLTFGERLAYQTLKHFDVIK